MKKKNYKYRCFPEEGEYCLKLGKLLDLDQELAWITDIKERFRGTWIMGPPGTGKTTLMLRMARYDASYGCAVIFIDPKGEHARQLYSLIPDKARVIYFSFDHPAFRINPLRKTGYRLPDLIDEFIEILDLLITETSPTNPPATEGMKKVLSEAITALAESDRNLSVLHDFLAYEKFRHEYLEKRFREIPLYWSEFDKKDKWGRPVNREPVETAYRVAIRLSKFVGDEKFKRIVDGENELDISELAREKKVVLLDTSGMGMEKRVYLTALFSFAVKSYCEFQKQTEYYPLMFYLDEAWMGMNSKFLYLLNFGRSFKVGFTLAHQQITQFDSEHPVKALQTVKGLASSCLTKIAFLPAGVDEAALLSGLYNLPQSAFLALGKYEAWIRIEKENSHVVMQRPLPARELEAPPVAKPERGEERLSARAATERAESASASERGTEREEAVSRENEDFLREGWFSCEGLVKRP